MAGTFRCLLQPEVSALPALLPSFPARIRESVTPESQSVESATPQLILRLSFTHLSELIQLPDDIQRRFYEIECLRGNWSVRKLRRQIDSLYYQRSGLPKNKAKLSAATADYIQSYREMWDSEEAGKELPR